MRKLSPAYVATSLVIAVAGGAACAAGVIARPGAAATAPQTVVTNRATLAPSAPEPATVSNSSSPTASSANTNNSSTQTTTLSDGSRSGSNTDSSLANVPVGSSPRTSLGTASSASTTVDGSRSGSNTDSSAANVPIGATGSGFLGASSVNSTGTTELGTPGINAAASVNGIVSPAIINGAPTTMITADGERVDNGASAGYANVQVDQGQFNGNAGSAVTVETARNSQSFDRAVNVVKRDRQRVGRNGQLLQSIAPRTNADRSREMPDDGPSPALTGLNSSLTRP